MEGGEYAKMVSEFKENKDRLISVICSCLPYGLEVNYDNEICDCVGYAYGKVILTKKFSSVSFGVDVEYVKPYLRPMSSMTDEEQVKYYGSIWWKSKMEFCQKNHFDYYDLIEKHLAYEKTKDMY